MCQTEHWAIHKKDCIYRPEPIAVPFVITVAKSELTYRNLCAIIYSYARHSVQIKEKLPLNLNEFPMPPPFVLRLYRDSNKSESEETIIPENILRVIDSISDSQSIFDSLLEINSYYIAMDWININPLTNSNHKVWDNIPFIDVQPFIGIKSDTDFEYSMSKSNDTIDLEDCLELHTKQEKLTPENPWFDSNVYFIDSQTKCDFLCSTGIVRNARTRAKPSNKSLYGVYLKFWSSN